MNKRLLLIGCLIIVCIAFLSRCIDSGAAAEVDIRGEKYAGATTCASCHRAIYDSYLTTAHHITSRPATRASIKGSFAPDSNVFIYRGNQQVLMEDKANGLFQSSYLDNHLRESHAFDVVIGSGTKAQTYLYWENNKYFQLPVSYFVAEHSWANSPGFPADHPRFDRIVPSTCFGCHGSAVGLKKVTMEGLSIHEEFEKNKIVYGIDCERCHGPAAEHVSFHTAHPEEKKAMHITRIASLKNQQRLDMCAICHSGLRTPQKPISAFLPGDSLIDYFFPDDSRRSPFEMDVHGTQYQLFTTSLCFRKSTGMNCSTCHHPHSNEKNNLQVFNTQCMNCHSEGHNFCTIKDVPAASLVQNCVDCHMPALPSTSIKLLTNGQTSPTPDYIRTHLITKYPTETKKVLAHLQAH